MRKLFIVLLSVISLAWFSGAVSFIFIHANASYNNTTVFTATVSEIRHDVLWFIVTNEFETELVIARNQSIKQLDALADLVDGQEIVFRVRNRSASNLNRSGERVEIIYLRDDSVQIISLQSYNEAIQTVRMRLVIGFASAGIFFLACGFAVVIHKRISDKNKKLKPYKK